MRPICIAAALIAALICAAALVSAPAKATETPIATYSFDEGVGATVADLAGNHDATIDGAEWAVGRYGGGMAFDADEHDILTVADAPDLELGEDFTIEAWVRPGHDNVWAPIVMKQGTQYPEYSYFLFGGAAESNIPLGAYAASEEEEEQVEGPEALPENTWSHLALTADGSNLRLYVNGALVDTGPSLAPQATQGTLTIGGADVFNDWFNGRIDELRIYGGALNQEEIKADKATPLQTPKAGPIANYSFDEGAGATVNDLAGNHDATIDGAEWAAGRYGGGMAFDASEHDILTVANHPDFALTEEFTIEAWVRPGEDNIWAPIVMKQGAQYPEHSYFLFGGAAESNIPLGAVAASEEEEEQVEGSEALPENTWSHLALTADGSKLRLYVNGQLVDTAPALAPQASEGPLVIGGADVFNDWFNGRIDELRIYSRALDQLEITTDKDQAATSAPAVSTGDASEVTATEATLSGTVNPNGGATAYYFDYGPTSSYGVKSPATPRSAGSGADDIAVEESLIGLTEGGTYHYRLVATNALGTVYGADQTLETPLLPEADTDSALGVDGTEAVLIGTVDPNGEGTEYQFEFGPTTGYGTTIVGEEKVVGTEGVTTEEGIGDLSPETTYHYRVVATSDAGTVAGPDKTFTTAKSNLPKGIANFGPDFFGIQWGHPHDLDSEQGVEMLKNSGAKFVRIELLNQFFTPISRYDQIFLLCAERGITVLPHFGGGHIPVENSEGVRPEWVAKVQQGVDRWGVGGTFWQEHPAFASFAPRHWEIWNEPNYIDNGFLPPAPPGQPASLEINPAVYGDLLAEASAVIKQGPRVNDKVIVGGLLSVGDGTTAVKMSVGSFLENMGHANAYDILGLHPYAFKTLNKANPRPENAAGVEQVVKRVKGNIKEAREAMGNSKPIWLTEIGWPVAGPGYEKDDGNHLNVSPAIQRDLLVATMSMLKTPEAVALNTDHLFYYNLQQVAPSANWYEHTGLRLEWALKVAGDPNSRWAPYLPAWYAYRAEAGQAGMWPKPPKNQTKGRDVKPRKLLQTTTLNPYGSPTRYWIKWGAGAASADPTKETYGKFTGAQLLAKAADGDINVDAAISSLDPGATYHYKVVAENDAGETTESPAELEKALQFTTPPSTSTSASHERVLHGNPGFAWVGGWVKEGEIDGPGPGVPSGNVRVNFKRSESEPTPIISREVPVVAGEYDTGYVSGLGRGKWFYRTVFPAQGEYDQSESAYHEFFVHDGVQVVAKHSGKCMDVNGASTDSLVPIMHGNCLDPMSAQNQVFSLVPQGSGFRFVARHSGKCLDVAYVSTADGASIIQQDCHGGANQVFNETWWGASDYAQYAATHSGKCLEVQGASQSWAPFQQWTCNGAAQQLLRLVPVDSGPIPTQTFLTLDQILHGTPGLVSFHGHLQAGTYSMAGRTVRIEFDNAATPAWDSSGGDLPVTVDGSGYFEVRDFEVPPGYWNIRARFIGGAEFAESATSPQNKTIMRGYLAKNRFSKQCLALSENKDKSGSAFIQWPCSAVNGNGLVFSFRPKGGGWYEIRPNGSKRCFDVAGASTANGAWTQLYDCLGGTAYNQQWRREPLAGQEGWFALIARHSSKCASNFNWSEQQGTRIIQYECVWASNQQWDLQGVINP